MSFDLERMQRILESKRALSRGLAARPVAEKLRLLDNLRERQIAIRGGTAQVQPSALHEKTAPHRIKPLGREKE